MPKLSNGARLKPRLKPLESLRGIMALWVLLSHVLAAAGLQYQKWPKPFGLAGEGNLAVDVFIIISGFVIFLLIDTQQETYRAFIIRRIFRLFPVYLVCLVASVPLVRFSIAALRALPWQDAHNTLQLKFYMDSMNHFFLNLGIHVFLLQGLFDSVLPSSSVAFIPPAWSLSLEWQFYLIAPLLFYFFNRQGRAWLSLLLMGTFLLGRFHTFDLGFLPGKIQFFLVGMVSYLGWTRRAEILERNPRLVPWLMPVSVCLVAWFTGSVPLIIWVMVFFSLMALEGNAQGLRMESWITGFLELPWFQAVGKISYSIYLSHMLLMYGIMYLMKDIPLAPKPYCLILLLSVVPATLAVSALLYRFVELPFIGWGKRISQRASNDPHTAIG